MASIRVSEDLYRELNRVAGQMRTELGHPVSMEDVLEHLLKTRRLKAADFAGAWKLTEKELDGIAKGLRGFWSSWKFPRD